MTTSRYLSLLAATALLASGLHWAWSEKEAYWIDDDGQRVVEFAIPLWEQLVYSGVVGTFAAVATTALIACLLEPLPRQCFQYKSDAVGRD